VNFFRVFFIVFGLNDKWMKCGREYSTLWPTLGYTMDLEFCDKFFSEEEFFGFML
jgi:hypothetical protein